MNGVIVTCWRWLIRPLVRHARHPDAHTFGIYEIAKPAPPTVVRAVDVPEPGGLFVMLPVAGALFWIRRKK